MTFIDLFAGVGGFRLGMEMAGHVCIGHCEIDKYANASYQAMHNPREDEWFARDITAVHTSDLPVCDCWCFGFPCQDISIAGKQAGFTGKRSSLFFTVTGLIRDLEETDRPKYLLIENVKNLLSVNRGFDFARLLIELDEIGYDAEWDVLNSKCFGVPQNRERVFIVGHLRGRSTGEVFPICGESGEAAQNFVKQIGNVMPTATRENPNQGRVYDPEGIAPCLNKAEGGDRQPMILQQSYCDRHGVMFTQKKILREVDAANTLTARGPSRGRGNHSPVTGVCDSKRIRRLTPRECFRLQGFPDEYFERAAAVCSDTQLYKQAGNSVTVNVVYEIARRMA